MIMNMNEKGRQTKLLAAIAVLAMVVCVFAVALPADAADGETSASLGDELSLVSVDGLEIKTTTFGASVSGIADGTKAATQGDFNTATGQWSYLTINGISDWMTANNLTTITITQINTALTGAYPGSFENDTKVNEGFDGKAAGTFLIPKDGSKVSITLEGTDSDSKEIVKTITIDCSDVYTQVKLGTADVSGDGYTYTNSTNTLSFENYDGHEIFYHSGALKVTLTGNNSISANAPKTTINNAILGAATSITISGTGSLAINQMADTGFGISAATVIIGDQTAGEKTKVTVTDGGNRAIYGWRAITIQNADVTVSASEKAIRGGSLTVIDSKVVANIVEGSPDVNSQGVDDIWGIKTSANVTLDANSSVTTEGFRLDGDESTLTITDGGLLVVSGDYVQNAGADLVKNIAGLYIDNLNEAETAVNGTPSDEDKGIYLTDNAGTYGNITVTDSTGATEEKIITVTDNLQNELTNGESQNVVFIVPGNMSSANLEINSVPDDKVLTINATTNAFTGTLSLNGTSAVLNNFSGYFTVRAGSVIINGTDMAGEINDIKGTVYISGSSSADGTLTFQPKTDAKEARVIIDGTYGALDVNNTFVFNNVELIVADDGTVNVANNAKIQLVGSEMSVSGKVLGTDGTIDADAKSKVYATSGSIIAPDLTGAGKFYIEDAMEEYRISKNVVSNISTTAQQKVYIDNSITIFSGFTVEIKGTLEVAEGMRVIVEDGAHLIINGQNSTADISGSIIVRGADGLVFSGKTMTVDGSITVNADSTSAALNVDGTTELNGTITVNKNSVAQFDKINVNQDATLTINGTATGAVTNYGSVVMNGTANNFNVNQENGGVVTVASVSGEMTVTDDGMTLRKDTKNSDANSIRFSGVTGMTVTSSVANKTVDGQKVYYAVMTLNGTAGPVKDAPSSTVTISDGTVTVADTLTVGKIDVVIDGTLDVDGTVTAVSEQGTWNISGSGTLDVSGTVRTNDAIHETGGVANVNAVYYQSIEDSITYHIYTNLAAALESDAEDLTILGNIEILVDTVIPDGKTVESDGTITVGNDDITDITLTVENGGYLSANTINVKATMVVENDDDLDCSNVLSDVSSQIEEDYITSTTYTNIYTALAQAQPGETVKITNKAGTVTLTRDVTIPAEVTLEVPTQKTLAVTEGVTLDVQGTLYLNNGELVAADSDDNGTDASFGMVASETNGNNITLKAVVTVSGLIKTSGTFEFGQYFVSGAYYDIQNYTYVSPVDDAVAIIDTIDYKEISVWGENTVGDISVVGDEDEEASITINYYSKDGVTVGEFSAGTVTLSDAVISINEKVAVNGTFANAVGSIELENTVAGTNGIKFADGYKTVDGEDVQVFNVSGYINGSTEGVNSSGVTFNDDVNVDGALTIEPKYKTLTSDEKFGNVIVSANATVTINGDGKVLTVTDGDASATDSNILIEGTVYALNGGKVDVDNATVTGTLTQAIRSENVTAGNITISGDLFVGLTAGDITAEGTKTSGSTTATVNGAVTVKGTIYALNGTSVDSLITEDLNSTQFYVEDELWMTAYGATATVSTTPAANAHLDAWNDENGKPVAPTGTSGDNWSINIATCPAVYADLDYEIYTITVFADPGIEAVYIDGKLMTSGMFTAPGVNPGDAVLYEGFQLTVSAGTHEVTYKIGNYYSGEATMTVNGDAVSGNTFTCSGTGTDNENVVIYLQGIQADAPSGGSTGTSSGDDGMGLTDYLLIILVILIVVMAIIVALRLMRS